jgi:electron-transferring-flavoprotein dehydrogenase
MSITSFGKFPRRDFALESDAGVPVGIPKAPRRYPAPDGTLTFDKLSSVYLSGNKTRDDAPNHIRVRRTVAAEVADAWVHMCPAQVYELAGEAGGGLVTVDVTASNCVQCGAITAKGGRLTPAEGGSGPEYSVM